MRNAPAALATLLASAALRAPPAAAQSGRPPAIRLEYSTPPGDGCPSEAAFRQRLAAQLGEDPVRDGADRVVRVEIAREGRRHGATLAVRGSDGRTLGGRAFPPTAGRCRDLADSVALSLSLLLQEAAATDSPPPAPPADAPPATAPLLAPVLPPSARVATPPAPLGEPPEPDVPPPARGVEVGLRLGYGSFTTTDASAWSARRESHGAYVPLAPDAFSGSFGVDAHAGWRFAPHFSVGLRGGYQFLRSVSEGGSMGAWALGVYGRWYVFPAAARWDVEPWVGVGVDFLARFTTRSTVPVAVGGMPLPSDAAFTERAVALPLSVGVDVHVARGLAVGVSAALSWWIHYEQCLEGRLETVATSPCSRVGTPTPAGSSLPARELVDNTAWSVALDARYTFAP